MIKLESLKKNQHFKLVLKEKKVHTDFFSIFAAKNFISNRNKNLLYISFVMKKKIGNAVKRNKIKRRLRNIAYDAIKKISLKLNYSYLVIAKPTMLNNEYTIIKETLFRNLESIN